MINRDTLTYIKETISPFILPYNLGITRDPKMEAYCDEVRRLKDKFYGLELNHIAR
jgi:hypothetical protein